MRPALLSILLLGCGATSAASPWLAPVEAPERALPILTRSAEGSPLRVPSVVVEVGGQPAVFMLDTGATHHFMLGATAWERGVRSIEHREGTDAHGRTFSTRIAEPRALRIGGAVAPLAFVFDSAPFFAADIEGGVSPQWLAPHDRAALLDFAAGRVSVVPLAAQPAWARASNLEVCRGGARPEDGRRFVATVTVDGFATRMFVDTGAEGSSVWAEGSAGRALRGRVERVESERALAAVVGEEAPASRVTQVEVLGAASGRSVRVVSDVDIRLGGAAVVEDVGLEPGDAECGIEGVLGWNVLSRCRLSLRRDGGALACTSGSRPPAHRAAPTRAPVAAVLRAFEVDPVCGTTREELAEIFDQSLLPRRYDSGAELFAELHPWLEALAWGLRDRCRDEGYLDAEIVEPLLRREGAAVNARVELREGRRYRVRSLQVVWERDGAPHEASPEVLARLRTRVGGPWVREALMRDYDDLVEREVAHGFVSEGFGYDAAPDAASWMVDVRLHIYLRSPRPTEATGRRAGGRSPG